MEAVLIKPVGQVEETFNTCYKLYYFPLRNTLWNTLKDREMAEDVVQETFMKFHHQLLLGEPPRYVWSLLSCVATNLCRNYWRSSRFQKEQGFDGPISEPKEPKSNFCEAYIQLETRQEILQRLNEIPLKYKEIIWLRFYQDLKLKDIAMRMDCPMGTVKSRLFNGLRLLKQKLEGNGRDVDESDGFSRG